MSMKQFFTKVSTVQETIPREWIDSTLRPAPKQAVGQPCKNCEVPEPVPVCVRQDDEHLPARLDNLKKTSPHTSETGKIQGVYSEREGRYPH